MATEPLPYPLYGPQYYLYRVSPLHNGTAPLLASLEIHARRFKDLIKGDALRGIQIATELQSGSTSSRRGPGGFRSCTWELLGDEAAWARAHPVENEDDDEMSVIAEVSTQEARGIVVEVQYERATYSAVLYGSAREKSRTAGFTILPLLFVKMPAPLKTLFVEYLTTAFDARITPMKLRTAFLSSAIETILQYTISRYERDLREVTVFSKGLQLQLSFPSTAPELKTLDINIEQADLLEFIKHGRRLAAQSSSATIGPFIRALEAYITQHLALSITHPAVVISRIVLGSYALSSDGRIKITTSAIEDAKHVWRLLLAEARSERIRSNEQVLKRAATGSKDARGLDWSNGLDKIPSDPPPPYELHDRSLINDLEH